MWAKSAIVLFLCMAMSHADASACTTRQLLQSPGGSEYFIQIHNGQFVNGCNNFKLAGWNQWEVVEAAAGAPFLSGASIPKGMTGPQLVRTLLQQGSKVGFNVMRTWAHSVNAQYALQTQPGEYNEATFKGLDYVLDEARRSNIKLILAFTSFWTPTGGVPEYLRWANETDIVQFYTNPKIISMYQNFVKTILTRTNTINGRVYRDDPTIMAFDLLNEPRCHGCPAGTISSWYNQQADYVRSLDSNHLITTGAEGFFGGSSSADWTANNPGAPGTDWFSKEGQDFLADSSGKNIDFATVHSWPDNWDDVSEDFQKRWIQSHIKAASTLNKPVVLEEWGKWVNVTAKATLDDRTTFMNIVFDAIENEMKNNPNSPLQGSLFWQWYLDGQQGAPTEGGGRGLFGIYETDAAFSSIKDNIKFIQSLNTPVAGCAIADVKAASIGPAPDLCASTWVDNLPGTGMEGPDCKTPINECVRGTDNCDPNAACIDTDAGFNCSCYYGYTGNGVQCTPDSSIQANLASMYWFEPKGQSCKAGLPVEYPAHTAGWVYDPMKSFSFYDTSGGGKYGSKSNVTLQQCMAACQVADTCESFVYNDILQQCFLARGQCPVYNYCLGKEATCSSTNDRGGTFEFGCGYWITYYRLDSDANLNCQGFVPNPASVGTPNTGALNAWAQWKQANPNAPIRTTPPEMITSTQVEASSNHSN